MSRVLKVSEKKKMELDSKATRTTTNISNSWGQFKWNINAGMSQIRRSVLGAKITADLIWPLCRAALWMSASQLPIHCTLKKPMEDDWLRVLWKWLCWHLLNCHRVLPFFLLRKYKFLTKVTLNFLSEEQHTLRYSQLTLKYWSYNHVIISYSNK